MTNIQVCRVCLAHDTRMCSIANTKLQDFYEKNTNIPFNTHDARQSVVCYICFHLLKKCQAFIESAIIGDKVLQKLFNSGTELTEKFFTMIDKSYLFTSFQQSPMAHVTTDAPGDFEVEILLENKTQIKEELSHMAGQGSEDEEIEHTDNFEIKIETYEDLGGKDKADPLNSGNAHHTINSDVDGLLESVNVERVMNDPNKEPKRRKGHYIEFREILLSKDEQIEQMIEKSNTLNYKHMLHKCALCYKGFVDQGAFENHKKKHDESSGSFECEICHLRYRTRRHLQLHADTYHRKVFACNSCSHRSQTVKQAKEHFKWQHCPHEGETDTSLEAPPEMREKNETIDIMKNKETENEEKDKGAPVLSTCKLDQTTKSLEGQKLYECKYCGRNFTQNCNLVVHLRIHTGERPYTCSYCGKRIAQKCNLLSHLKIHMEIKPFICNYCGYRFDNMTNLITHVKKHTGEKMVTCDYCNKRYNTKSNLIRHIRIHTGEKPFKCNYCGIGFTNKPNFLNHVRKHTGERPYVCDYCGKKFAQRTNFTVHMRIHTGEKPYSCIYCTKMFSSKTGITKHQKTHTREKKFTCNQCGNTFRNMYNLISHTKIHTGEKRFECNICEKKFMRNNQLTSHLRIHTGERPFGCDFCEKKFTEKNGLIKHLRTHTIRKQ